MGRPAEDVDAAGSGRVAVAAGPATDEGTAVVATGGTSIGAGCVALSSERVVVPEGLSGVAEGVAFAVEHAVTRTSTIAVTWRRRLSIAWEFY